MRRFEFHTPTDPPELVMAERLESIAADLERIADVLEEDER